MKIDDLKNTKIYLSNVEDRRKFQERMFKLGVGWYGGGENVEELDKCFFYINGDLHLTTGNEDKYDADYFKKHDYEQIFLYDVLAIEVPIIDFKPYDKVLVRDCNTQLWLPTLYAYYNNDSYLHYVSISGNSYRQCIPYEGNEHLAGTTNSPK